ncbi:MAG: hypothetical protein Q4G13_04100 [Moraxella sp.]|nr:hypothetical protein [Moraxella sp.]
MQIQQKLALRQTSKIKMKKVLLSVAVAAVGAAVLKNRQKIFGALGVSALAIVAPAHAVMSEQAVRVYASAMQQAANSKNINQVARLISDDAVISLNRQGRGSSTLTKSNYLDLLQKSWAEASNYRYEIEVSDIVITADQARAQVSTMETWIKDGKPTTIRTSSRATLGINNNNAVLLRSVTQVTVN